MYWRQTSAWPTIGRGDIEHATHEYSDDTDDSTRAMEACLWQETGGCHHHHLKLAEGQTDTNKIQSTIKSHSTRYICWYEICNDTSVR